MNFRSVRVGELVHRELSKIIVRELEFPAGTLVTISSVEVDKKLERALVNVSIIPADKEEEAMEALEKARGYLFHLLFKKLNIKPMPDIMFRADRGFENAAKVEKKLLEAEDEEKLKNFRGEVE